MLTGDENVVEVPFVVIWRIQDAEKYLFRIQNPEQTVKDVAESAMREVVGESDFDRIASPSPMRSSNGGSACRTQGLLPLTG